jgi:hypothetical protein
MLYLFFGLSGRKAQESLGFLVKYEYCGEVGGGPFFASETVLGAQTSDTMRKYQ